MPGSEKRRFDAGPGVSRRRFLQLTAGGLAWLATGIRSAFAAPYRVGVGRSADPYEATLRAVAASGEWPAGKILGKTVAIKPNLVVPMAADSGVTTDPEVVRALVDLALEAGAAEVFIIEDAVRGDHFSACGYGFFHAYDPRVRLVYQSDEPLVLAKVPRGLTHLRMYIAEILLSDDVIFMSAAKLKTHSHTHATLAMKNLIGLAPVEKYRIPPDEWRFPLHDRGISQAIVDLNLLRPVDYAVVDGVVGMEGDGPVSGDPVHMDMVIAGKNVVAVDRVCLEATRLPQRGVLHLAYAAHKGMGPKNLRDVQILGDPFTPRPFRWPPGLPPLLAYPRLYPKVFAPRAGQKVRIIYRLYPFPCFRRVNIWRTRETSPELDHIRVLREWESRPPGDEVLTWDGRDDSGAIVPSGIYCANVEAEYRDSGTSVHASGWVWVMGS